MRAIEIDGKKYPVLCDVNVIEKIQERYKSLENMAENIAIVRESKWMLTQMINEADQYLRVHEGRGFLDQPMTEEKLGMMLTMADLYENYKMGQIIIDAFNDGMSGRKNLIAGQSKKKPRNGKRRKKKPSTLPGSNISQ